MKYNLIPSGKSNGADTIFIYILPAAFEGSSYSIAYPDCKTEDILAERITIRTFEGYSPKAVKEIEVELKERLQKKHIRYAERLNTYFTAGIGVFILGIVNWVIPDPLPLVDELLFTIGGGLTAWKAWNDRKVKLPALIDQNYRYGYDGVRPEVETDSILTTVFKSIRCKIDPRAAGEVNENLDSIEIESLWMTRYLNIQDLTASIDSGISGIGDLIGVIEKVFPIREIVKLEGRNQSKRVRSRLQNLKQEIIRKTGITQDALTVYCEFYRTFDNISA